MPLQSSRQMALGKISQGFSRRACCAHRLELEALVLPAGRQGGLPGHALVMVPHIASVTFPGTLAAGLCAGTQGM